jgi:lactose/L-arabinose transport system substrate-binding protein
MSTSKRSRNGLTRRDFLRLSAGGLGAAALARPFGGFGPWLKPQGQGIDPNDMKGKVTIWGYTGTIDHFNAAKDGLIKKYPGLEIETQQFDYLQAHANILNALTSGMGVPDLVNFDVDYVGDFGAGMLDISEQFKPYADQFVPVAIKLASYQGKLIGLPQDNEPMGLGYRKDIFDKYGITEDNLATWDGFIEAGKKLWKDSGNKIKIISMDAPGSQMPVLGEPHQIHEVFLHEAGYPGVFFNKADDKVIIDTPEAIAAIKKFKAVCDPDVAYTFQDKNSSVAAYKASFVATNIFPSWWQYALASTLPDEAGGWRVMRLPALEKGGLRVAFQIPTVTGIPAQSANPKAAWGVLYEAQLTKEAQQKFYDVNHILPTHKEIVAKLNDTPLDYFGGQKVYKLLDEVLADIPDVYFGKGWVEARAILTTGIEPIMRGEVSVEDGLKKSADEMRRKLNKS